MTTSNNEHITHEGDVFEMVDGLYYGYAKTQSFPKKQPLLHWEGGKIPWDMYCMWATFLRWAYATHKSEAQVTLVYHEEHKIWNTLVYPQEVAGASTDEIKTGNMALYEEPLTRGFEVAGSEHSHASMPAFQSGTDSHNELDRSGIHITLGSFDKAALTFHARMTFRGYQYHKIYIAEWIEFPEVLATLPEELKETCQDYYLTHPAEIEFPPEWKSRVRLKYTQGYDNQGSGYNTKKIPPKTIPASVKGFMSNEELLLKENTEAQPRESFGSISNKVYSELITGFDDVQQQVFRHMDGFHCSSSETLSAARKAWNINMQAESQEFEDEGAKTDWVFKLLSIEESELLYIMEDLNCTPEEIGQDAEMIEQAVVVAMIQEAGGE